MKKYLLILLVLSDLHFNLGVAAESAGSGKNHPFERVELGYPGGEECSFEYSPIHFCDDVHLEYINLAIQKYAVNFNGHYILLPIPERKEYFEHSLVAIDVVTGIVYPLPFDSYSGVVDKKGNAHNYGKLSFDLKSNKICVNGTVVAYKQEDSGNMCWTFEKNKFVGHSTPYME
ncbi:hypothetical protein [Paraburkholderia phenazinium]|jgi:hypothetical protein|uniref:WG repeat-containing protein n=1 Tax=Paraburkholderia phenazinium TaxID=60549 RepID=A0A1N6EJA9_9BURK|nr:hypothetical protein [Paraburkholderia phenazinium]SIN83125.1 hypothetical protein SAMN05444168_0711 [Paraburkholderia phenazinium]